jgi:hypothetical protein
LRTPQRPRWQGDINTSALTFCQLFVALEDAQSRSFEVKMLLAPRGCGLA